MRNPEGKKKKKAKANGEIRNTGSRAPTKKDCAEKSRNEIESTNFSSLTPIAVFVIYFFFFANITKITTVKLGRTTEADSEEKVNATHYIRRKKNTKETIRKRVVGAVVRR